MNTSHMPDGTEGLAHSRDTNYPQPVKAPLLLLWLLGWGKNPVTGAPFQSQGSPGWGAQ